MSFVYFLLFLEASSLNTPSSTSYPLVDYGSFPVAFAAFLIFILTYIATNIWNNYRHIADRYSEILQMGISNPDLMDPKKTRQYNQVWELGSPERYSYEIYAWLCWEHAYHLYSLPLPLISPFYRKKMLKRYVNTLETYCRLHGLWLKNNVSFFPDVKFQDFIEIRGWRNYFDARTADRLRWNFEVDDYETKILHPYLVKENNPLLNYINSIKKEEELTIADFGCGIGTFVDELTSNHKFKNIYGIDYSDKMIESCKFRCRFCKNVKIIKMDMKDLTPLYDEFDIVFSINSILPREPHDTEKIFIEIAKTLKPSGKFVAILPSFDTIEHLRDLEFKKFKEKREKEKKIFSSLWAKYDTWKLFSLERKMVTKKRLYADDKINVQRFIHEDDIKSFFDKAGLRLLRKEKLYYPWDIAKKFNYGYHPGKEEIWDWFVVAEKIPEGES